MLPTSAGMGDYRLDSVVVDYRTLPGGEFAPYNECKTIVHETGRGRSLEHTFEGGCTAEGKRGRYGDRHAYRGLPQLRLPRGWRRHVLGQQRHAGGTDPIHNYCTGTWATRTTAA
jgi:hypothetical protein